MVKLVILFVCLFVDSPSGHPLWWRNGWILNQRLMILVKMRLIRKARMMVFVYENVYWSSLFFTIVIGFGVEDDGVEFREFCADLFFVFPNYCFCFYKESEDGGIDFSWIVSANLICEIFSWWDWVLISLKFHIRLFTKVWNKAWGSCQSTARISVRMLYRNSRK